MLLSFIILSYNQKELVQKCIDSINFSGIPKNKYEIIIVDDGSSDSSMEYLKSSENTVLIPMRKNTRNQSLLRNMGIGVAKGKYLMFADGDDYYNSVELGKLYNEFKDMEFDLFMSSMLHVYCESKRLYLSKISSTSFINDKEIDHGTQMYVASRSFIMENNLWFDEIKYNWDSEDMYFSYRLINCAKTILYSNYNNFNYIHLLYNGNNTSDKYKNELYFEYLNELYQDLLKILTNKDIIRLLEVYMIQETIRIFGGVNYQ